MWNRLWPILVIVTANTVYNISAKSTPGDIDPFASLALSYFTATVVSLILFFVFGAGKSLAGEMSKANWTTWALGAAIVFLEFGFLCVYRAGWDIGTASLFAGIALSCVLVFVGIFAYGETLTARKIAGVAVCALGMVLLAK